MEKYITLILIFFVAGINAFAQSGEDKSVKNFLSDNVETAKSAKKTVILGGNLTATFGDFTEIWISPSLGFMASPEVQLGLYLTYRHAWNKTTSQTSGESTIQYNAFGGSVYLDYFPAKQLYLKTEFAYENYKNFNSTNTDANTGVPFIFLGLGYNQAISKSAFLNLGIKVDVLNNDNSPYDSFTPFFEAALGFGI